MTYIEGTPGIDFLKGTLNPDTIKGLSANDQIQGLAGDDVLLGNGANDTLFGGKGNDTLFGGKGDDLLVGNEGANWMIGGGGNDLFVLSDNQPNLGDIDRILDFSKGHDRVVLENNLSFDNLTISQGLSSTTISDKVTGNIIALLSGNLALDRSDFMNIGQILPITAQGTFGNQNINLEVAQTVQQQTIGLMYRDDLPRDRGMLFPINPPQVISLWMKNVTIPLDMIFLRNGQIQNILSNVPPCSSDNCPTYSSNVEVDQVIELKGGRAAELNLKIGDKIPITIIS
jgi:uncharacterized membrane protein (UPF0127 family)